MSGSVAATITQKDPSKRPILEGDAWTLEILADFEQRAADYVDEEIDLSKTPAASLIVRGIKSADFRNWYDLGEDQYASMPLADFMQLVRGVFLPTDWDLKMKEKIYASSQGSRRFMEFVLETTRLNQILPKASRIPNNALRDILQSRLSAKLLRLVHRTTIALTPDSTATFKQAVVDDKGGETFQDVTRSVDKSRMRLTEWVTEVHKLDEQVREDEEEMRTQMALMLRLERARVAKQPSAPVAAPRFTPKPTTATSAPALEWYPPKLTQAEKSLLWSHQGCTKCRKFYAGHQVKECTVGFPTKASYRALTPEMATRAQAAHEKCASEANPAEDLPQVEEVPSSESEYVPPSFDEPHLYPQLGRPSITRGQHLQATSDHSRGLNGQRSGLPISKRKCVHDLQLAWIANK